MDRQYARSGKRAVHELADRFWPHVEKSDGCWLWTGSMKPNGYGTLRYDASAHRVSWEIANGPIPAGKVICHSCDNRRCVRPDHLFLGTQQDNINDAVAKGRMPHGERQGHATARDADILAIREAAAAGEMYRSIGSRYGLTRAVVGGICRGRTYGHIGGPLQTSDRRGEANRRRKVA